MPEEKILLSKCEKHYKTWGSLWDVPDNVWQEVIVGFVDQGRKHHPGLLLPNCYSPIDFPMLCGTSQEKKGEFYATDVWEDIGKRTYFPCEIPGGYVIAAAHGKEISLSTHKPELSREEQERLRQRLKQRPSRNTPQNNARRNYFYNIAAAINETPQDDVFSPEAFQNDDPKKFFEGQIRHFSEKGTRVVLLKKWSKDSFLVAPLSFEECPKVQLDFKLPEGRVIQIWNTWTVLRKTLQESTPEGQLSKGDLEKVQSVLFYFFNGGTPADNKEDKPGIGEYNEDETIQAYKKAGWSHFAEIATKGYASILAGTEQDPAPHSPTAANFILWRNPPRKDTTWHIKLQKGSSIFKLEIQYLVAGSSIAFYATDEKNQSTHVLDGWIIKNTTEETLGQFDDGAMEIENYVPTEQNGSFKLFDAEGNQIPVACGK